MEIFESRWTTSTLSQASKSLVISACDSSSASRRFARVLPEKTTPQPKVSSGPLRSQTLMSCAESARFIRIAKYNPAGPPPMILIFIYDGLPLRTKDEGELGFTRV